MVLSLIAAASENNVIGKGNTLPWDLPDDLQHFRTVTKGCPVIMGRKTHESIGRVLPGRRNIVITRQQRSFEGCDTAASLEQAMEIAKADDPREVFVIGGEEIFRAALPQADRIYLTRVRADIEGDVHFPEFSSEEWKEVSRTNHAEDERHAHAFSFLLFERR